MVRDDVGALYERAAGELLEAVQQAFHDQGRCVLGIVGGRTVEGLFSAIEHHLEGRALHGEIHVFWLDERIHWEKNFLQSLPFLERFAQQLNLTWHPIMSATPEAALREVQDISGELRALGGLDVIVASAGEDGHIASLFPNHPALEVREESYIIVQDAPKPPPVRVTMSVPLLLTAKQGFLFFIGKEEAHTRFQDASVSERECPARLLKRLAKLHVYDAK